MALENRISGLPPPRGQDPEDTRVRSPFDTSPTLRVGDTQDERTKVGPPVFESRPAAPSPPLAPNLRRSPLRSDCTLGRDVPRKGVAIGFQTRWADRRPIPQRGRWPTDVGVFPQRPRWIPRLLGRDRDLRMSMVYVPPRFRRPSLESGEFSARGFPGNRDRTLVFRKDEIPLGLSTSMLTGGSLPPPSPTPTTWKGRDSLPALPASRLSSRSGGSILRRGVQRAEGVPAERAHSPSGGSWIIWAGPRRFPGPGEKLPGWRTANAPERAS